MESVMEGWLLKSPPEKKLVRACSNHFALDYVHDEFSCLGQRWTKRWFVLKESGRLPGQYVLEYYDTEKQSKKHRKPRRVIDLDQCEQVDANVPCEQHDEYNFMFSIHTLERRFFLMTETEDNMLRWVQSLCRACGLQRDSSTGSDGNASDQETDHQLIRGTEPSPQQLFSHASAAADSLQNSRFAVDGSGSAGGALTLAGSNTANVGLRSAPNKTTNAHSMPSSVATFPLMPTTPFASLPPSSGEDETSAGSDATTITNLHGAPVVLPSSSTATTTPRSRPPPLMLRTTNINSMLLSSNLLDSCTAMPTTSHARQSASSLPVAPPPPKPVMPALPYDHDNDVIDANWSQTHQAYRRTGSDSPYFHLHDFRTGIACINTPMSLRSNSSFDESDSATVPDTIGGQAAAYDVPPPITRSFASNVDAGVSKFSATSTEPPDPNASSSNFASKILPKPPVPTKPSFTANNQSLRNQLQQQTSASFIPTGSSVTPNAQPENCNPATEARAPLQQVTENLYAAPVEHIYDDKIQSASKSNDVAGQLRKPSLSAAGIGQSMFLSTTTLRSSEGSSGFASASSMMRQPQSTLHGPITQPRPNATMSSMSPPVTVDRNSFVRSTQGGIHLSAAVSSSARRNTKSTSTSSSSLLQQPTTPPAPTVTAPSGSIYDLPGSGDHAAVSGKNFGDTVIGSRCGDSAESTATIIPLPLSADGAGDASLYDHPKSFAPADDGEGTSHYDSPSALTSSTTSSSQLILPQRVKKQRANAEAAEQLPEQSSSSDDEEEAVTTTSDNDGDFADGGVADSPSAEKNNASQGPFQPIRTNYRGGHRPWAAAGTFSAHASAIDMARSETRVAQDLQIEPSTSMNVSSSSSSVSSLVAAAEHKLLNNNGITNNRQHSASRSSIGRSKRVESRQNHRQQSQQQLFDDGSQQLPASSTGRHAVPTPSLSHSNSSDLEYLRVSSAVFPSSELSSATEYLTIDPVFGSSSSSLAAGSGQITPVGNGDQTISTAPNVPPRSPKNLVNAAAPPSHQYGSAQHRRSSSSSVTSPPLPTSVPSNEQRRRQQLPPGSSFTVGRHLHASTRSNTSSISGVSHTNGSVAGNDAVVTGKDQYHEIDVFRTNALMQTMLMARTNAGGSGNTNTLSSRDTAAARGSMSSSSTLK